MKILRQGREQEFKWFRGTCKVCGCIFECDGSELVQANWTRCPCCSRAVDVKEVANLDPKQDAEMRHADRFAQKGINP